jgi:hypothetical protein
LREDWALIESSIAKQYGIRIRQHTDMPWDEFCTLIAGLMPDTPLGSIVAIRSEKDSKVIGKFTSEQRKIYSDWQTKIAMSKLENEEQLDKEMEQLSKMFASMFGNKEVRQ